MSDMRFWRRDLLKAGAGGMLLVGVGSQAATADTGEKNVLLDEDFRDYEPGDSPTGWDTAGNTDQEVVSSPSLSHDRAFRYSGTAGGCWEAIAQSPEKAAIASEGTTVIDGDIRVGSGFHGCHSNTAQIKISTCDDGWPCGEKQRLISFADTGRIEVSGADDDLGSWTQNKWYSFTITYERSDGQVTYTVEVEGEETTVEKEEGGFEDEIAHLWLNTGGYTNYVDNVKITYDDSEISGDPGSGSISLTPQEIDFGVQSIASTPQRTLTLENTTDQPFTVDADIPASVRFSPDDDLFDIDLPFVGVEPPFSLDPGESQTAVLELDTSEAVQNSSMDGDAHLRQSISLSTESDEIAEVPTRVTIFNGEAIESLRNAANANSDLFDAEKIQKGGAYNNLSNMYKNLFEIVKELSTGPNYKEAIKPLVDFASSVPQTAENINIGEGIRKAKFDQTLFEFSPEEFEDGYDEVSNDFDDVITGIENENRSEISNSYDDAEKRLKNLTHKWDESKGAFKNILKNTLTGEDALEKAEGLVVEYTKAVDGLFKLVQGTTPLYLTTASPVNIAATDPDGQKVGPDENEIPGSIYKEIDRGKDGTTEDLIYIQDKKPGEYRINVSESDDGSGDSFSLVAVTDNESMVIADETPVSDIPDDGYKIEASEDPESDPVGARPEDYATEDGLVTVNGLREAIADWRSTDITDELLSQVTTVWIEHKEVD